MKRTTNIGCLVILVIFCLISVTVYFLSARIATVDSIVNADEYAKLAEDKLVEKLGEPDHIENWRNSNSLGESYQVKTYTYTSTGQEFLVADGTVIRMSLYSKHFSDLNEESFSFVSKQEIFGMLGIEPSDNLQVLTKTKNAFRWRNATDKIDEIFIPSIKDKKFDIIKVTYDLRYF